MPLPQTVGLRIERAAEAERCPEFKLPVQCGRVRVLFRPCARADGIAHMLRLACMVLSDLRRAETVSLDPTASTDVCTVYSQPQQERAFCRLIAWDTFHLARKSMS